MNCGTLIRASALLQPDPERVKNLPSRRDTQPISRGDTTQIERPNVPPRREIPAPVDPLDLDELPETTGRPIVPRKKPAKGMSNLTKASIIAVGGAVFMLTIVVVGMLINKALSEGPAIAVPAPPVVAPAKKQTETPEQMARRTAWDHTQRLAREIDANKREIARLHIALKEATTKHFHSVQKELEAAREKGQVLAVQEATWKAEYERLSRLAP